MTGDTLETISEQRTFGGVQGFYRHDSRETGTPMRFGVFRPPQAADGPVPVLTFLAGLTCTEETFAIKAGAQRLAAQYGIMVVTPDTSPRGAGLGGEDDDWDVGTGAGFYLDATRAPWSRHYRMASYVADELPALIADRFPARTDRQGIFGHSMGGHGALTLALKRPGAYLSLSAFAPIAAPCACPWGKKAFEFYLEDPATEGPAYDATALVDGGARFDGLILVDQGEADPFLADQLYPDRFEKACAATGQALTLRRHPGYDHSYYFIATAITDHMAHHATALTR